MNVVRDHVIHSRGGKLGTGVSSAADVARIVEQSVVQPRPRGIVIHFHGGLVSQASGMGIAERLAVDYDGAGAYPIFFVWEAGFLETIRNNLRDILRDKVFHELLKKAGEWVLKEGAGSIATRGAGQAVDATQLREDFDRWLTGQSALPPVRLDTPARGGLTRGILPDEDELAARIEAEIGTDQDFEATMAGLAVASGKTNLAATRGAGIQPAPVQVLVDRGALDEMFPQQPGAATRGGIPWLSVAKFLAKVTIAALRRFLSDRDHGPYVTVVEEVLRAAYLAKIGEVIWRQMKKDTEDAFEVGNFAGTVLLAELAKQKGAGRALPTLTLVGHSTGAVYINNFLRHAAQDLPGVQFNILFLAPACRCEDFANTLRNQQASIANFRMFAMHDGLEQNDQLLSVVYPRSLLYFVSGVVEGDPDVPLVGMERFFANQQVFDEDKFPDVSFVRQYLAAPKRAVWSLSAGGLGVATSSTSHGDFDNDKDTIGSLTAIIKNGF